MSDDDLTAAERQVGAAERALLNANGADPGELERLRAALQEARQARSELEHLRVKPEAQTEELAEALKRLEERQRSEIARLEEQVVELKAKLEVDKRLSAIKQTPGARR